MYEFSTTFIVRKYTGSQNQSTDGATAHGATIDALGVHVIETLVTTLRNDCVRLRFQVDATVL